MYATSEGVVSHNVLYYQQLSNAVTKSVLSQYLFRVTTKRVPSRVTSFW